MCANLCASLSKQFECTNVWNVPVLGSFSVAETFLQRKAVNNSDNLQLPIFKFRVRKAGFLTVLLMAFLLNVRQGWAQSAGFNNTFIVLSLNGGANAFYDLNAATANTDFNTAALGTFAAGSSNLTLKGAEHNVFKCGSADLTSTRLYYRIYPTASPSGSYTAQSIGFTSGFANGCGGQDQVWSNTGLTINLLAGLGAGAYTVEVYSDATITCCGGTAFASNSGNNYKATFTVSSIVWANTTASTAWYTAANWNPSTASTAWLAGSVAEFQNAGTATAAGINMATAALSLGQIDVTAARTRALTIGNSSATVGTLTLNGTTAGSNANVILRNSSASLLTLQNNETGTGKTMNIALGNATTNTIDAAGAGGLAISSVISGTSRSITKIGTGTLTLSGTNTYSGGTIISGGTVSAGAAANLGDAGGAITLGTGATSATLAATGTFTRNALNVTTSSSAGVINVATSQTLTLAALNTASGTDNTTKIGKSGAGTLTLSGAGSYVGQTQIGEGTVIVSNNTGLGTNNSTVARGIDLGLNVGDVSQANNVSVLATTGITVPQSIYVAPNTTSATRTVGVSGAGSATFNNEIYLDGALIANAGAGNTLTLSGNLINTGGLTVSTGTTLLSGTNTYSGTTTVSSGTLRLGNASALGSTAASTSITSGAVLDLNGINYSNSEALTVNGTGISTDGAIINSSATGATYAGLITLGSASSIVGGTGTIAISNTGTITGSGFALTLGGAQGGSIAGIVGTGTGTLTKQDVGTWTLSGANTYTGATAISGGTLRLGAAGVVADGSAISLGGGTLSSGASAGFSETMETLALTANSTIALGTGNHSLTFANSSAVSWTAATTLTITGWTGTVGTSGTAGKIFIGNTTGTLTSGQLAQISFSGYSAGAMLLSTGEVVPLLSPPTIATTVAASSITNTAASTGGQTIAGSSLSAKGVVYSTAAVSTTPTLSNSVLTDGGTTTANFTSSLTGLDAETQYYVRAYATNAAGTGYGPAINFRTLSNPATAQAAGLGATASASGELTISWTGATFPGTGATQGGYALIYATGTPTLSSANGAAPAAGVGTLVTITPTNLPTAPATSHVLTGLTGGTTYNFLLVPFTWNGTNAATYNYLTTSAPTASAVAVTNPAITTTTAITSITISSAASGGSGISANGGTISAKGIVWNTSTAPTTANSSTNDGTGTASFSSSLTSLSAQTLYYVRSYATNDVGTAYGNELSFYTLSNEPTAAATSFTATSNGSSQIDLSWTAATFPGAGATNNGYILLRRIDSTNPTTTSVTDGVAPASLSLPSGTTLATTITSGATASFNNTGLAASSQYNYIIIPFTWDGSNAATYNYYLTSAPNANATTDAGLPTVDVTTAASSITNNSASSGGSTLVAGGSAITAKGVAYNTSSAPTTANSTTSDGSGTANFASSLTGLSAQTLYYVRAYVTNSAGTGYGNEISFRTLSNPATAQASGLSATVSASGELTINWTGATFPASGATQGGYALIYSTGTPTLSSTNGAAPAAGVGTLVTITPTNLPTAPATSHVLSGLTAGTTYNFLLVPFTWNGTNATTYNYLTTSAPTASATAVTTASVTTTAASSITNTTASSGGSAVAAGGGTISAKGVVWNTAAAPTLANSSTSNGTGTSGYTSNLTSLSAETQYFVRAYVTNELGTAYGNELNFRTLSNAPTAQASGLSASATSASNIDLTWTAATFPGSGATVTGYVLLRATSPNTPSLGNGNGAAPTAGANTTIIGSSISGAAISASNSGLAAITTFNYLLVPFTWDGVNASTYNYLTTAAPIANATTFASLPIAQPTALTHSAVTATTITTSWTTAGGGPSGYVVLRSTGSSPNTDPVSGTSYTAGNTLGNATVVSVGAAVTTGAQTGLVDGTTYYYEVYSYNGTGSTRNYLTTSPLSGTQATTAVSAPTATAGTTITDSGFTANWGSVASAASYQLDVFPLTYDSFDNATTLFSVTSGTGVYFTGNSAASDSPATTTFVSNGTHSFGKSNGSVSTTSTNINTTALASPQLSFKVASFSITSIGNGADAGDIVTVEVSADGGNTYNSTVRVVGNSNARWSFTSGTGVASTAYDGDATPVDFTPAGGGARTTDGYSTVTVTGLPSTTNMRVRITLVNNSANERWLIDDFTISPAPANVSGYNSLSVAGTTQTITGLSSNTTYGYVVRTVGTNTTSGNSNTIAVTTLVGQSDADFRTIASGNFSTTSNWEYNDGTSWVTATQAPGANNNTTVQAAHSITMNVAHSMNTGKTMTVNGALSTGTFVISGGTFTLASGATLTVGSANGIASTGATGNIQTTTRTFNAAANYIYAGAAAQITGTALPTTITGSLAIQSVANTVTLTNAPSTTDSLSLQSGLFAIGSGATLNISANGKVVAASGDFATGITGGTINFVGTGSFTGNCNPFNVYVSNGVNFGSGTVTIQNGGTFRINSGGFVNTNAPFYGSGSTLQYNVGATYARSLEWSASSGRGYPHHVTISNNTTLNPVGTAGAYAAVALRTAGNLTIDNGASLYLDFGGNNMTEDLIILGNITMNGNFSGSGASGSDIFVGGDWTNNGTTANFLPNSRAVFLNGTGTQTIAGTNASFPVFPYLFIDKTAGSVGLSRDVQVSAQFVLSSSNVANINAGSFTLNVSGTATTALNRQGSGHIIGNLRRGIGTGTNSYAYPIGDASNYTPVSLDFNNVTGAGNVTLKSTAAEQSQIGSSGLDSTLSVNRYFTATNNATTFTSYAATLNFVSGDRDAGITTNDLLVGLYNSTWSYPTVGTITSTSIQASGVASFGDFVTAECKTPTIYTVTGGGEYCSGSGGVDVSISDSELGVNYQLKKDGVNLGSAATGTGNTLSFGNQTATGLYSVLANSLATSSCNNTMTDSVLVNVNSVVIPSVSIGGSATTFCDGTSVTFTATPQFGGSTPSYQWKVNGNNVGTDNTTFSTSTLVDGDAVTCVLTSGEACPSPATASSNSIEVTVVSFETPSISINLSSGTTICDGDLVTVTSTSVFGGGLPTFDWLVNGISTGESDSTFSTFSLNNSDQVSCIFTSNFLCTTVGADTSNTLTFTVVVPPQVDAGTSMTTCGTTAYTFANGATNSNTTSIAWTENGAGSITAGANTLTPTYTPAAGDLGSTVTFTLTGLGNSPCAEIADNVTLQIDGLTLYYNDNDSDGFGDALSSPVASCTPVAGKVADNTDCCDSNNDINPGTEWWADADGDGVGGFIFATGCISGCSGFASTIPYYPGAHGGTPYAIDCNDGEASAYPGAAELCGNSIDDDCDGIVDEGCSGIANDSFDYADAIQVNTSNTFYPNCVSIAGTLLNADPSAEANPANVASGGGRDSWFRFVAPSSAVRIRVAPTGFNAVIELRTAAHPAGQVDVENANSAVGGIEIMNVGGLTSGQTYYIAVRNYDNTAGGTFTICVSPLMPSGCGTAQAVGGLNLCSSFKAIYRGANSYTFNFTGTGGTAPTPFATTSASSTGLIAMSTPALALRNGGIYNVRVDANYSLTNGIGASDPTITIVGTACSRTMATAPLMEVTSIQRCAVATLNRSALLRAVTTTGSSSACSATSYNFRFTRVADCGGTAISGVTPFVVSTSGTYLSLYAAFPNGLYPLPNLGYWKVEIAPVFTYGATAYGPARVIQVNNTATSSMLPEEELAEMERLQQEGGAGQAASIYPNPGNGERVFISLSDQAEIVSCRIFDEMGRAVDGFLVTRISGTTAVVEFNQRLASGVYHIQWSNGTEQQVTRWIVTN